MAVKSKAFTYLENDKFHHAQTDKAHTYIDSERQWADFVKNVTLADLNFLKRKGFNLKDLLDDKKLYNRKAKLLKEESESYDLNPEEKINLKTFSKRANEIKSEIKDCDRLIHDNAKAISINIGLLCTMTRHLSVINSISNGSQFRSGNESIAVVHSKDYSKMAIKALKSGLSSEPVYQVNSASGRVEALSNSLNLAYNHIKGSFYVYMITLTVPNVNRGQLVKALQGTKYHNHAHGGLVDKVRIFLKYFKRNGLENGGKILGGVRSFEVTVNKDKLQKYDSKGIFHPHCHIFLLTDTPISLPKGLHAKANGRDMMLTVKSQLWNEWNKLNNGYWSESLSPQAFQVEKAFNPDKQEKSKQEAVASAVSEASKYCIKPDFYKNLKDPKNSFQKRIFAELLSSEYGFHAKENFGIIRKASSIMNHIPFSNAVASAMNMNGRFNISGKATLPDMLTKIGFAHVNQSEKLGDYLQINKDRLLSDRMILFENRELLAKASIDGKTLAKNLKDLSKSKKDFWANTLKDLPYQSVKGLITKIGNISSKNHAKALLDTNLKKRERKALNDKAWDENRIYRALKHLANKDGNINLGFKTAPFFAEAVRTWENIFTSELAKHHLVHKGWRFHAGYYKGISYKEREIIGKALGSADNAFKVVGAPIPNEKPDPHHVGCFIDKNGHQISYYHYEKLTAYYNKDSKGMLQANNYFDPTGKAWNFSLRK